MQTFLSCFYWLNINIFNCSNSKIIILEYQINCDVTLFKKGLTQSMLYSEKFMQYHSLFAAPPAHFQIINGHSFKGEL